MSTETIIEVNPVRNKATFTHGEVAEGAFVRDKTVHTHRVGVRKETVRDKDGSAHGKRQGSEGGFAGIRRVRIQGRA